MPTEPSSTLNSHCHAQLELVFFIQCQSIIFRHQFPNPRLAWNALLKFGRLCQGPELDRWKSAKEGEGKANILASDYDHYRNVRSPLLFHKISRHSTTFGWIVRLSATLCPRLATCCLWRSTAEVKSSFALARTLPSAYRSRAI